jgi:DNA-binding response OmpR family regulator
LARHRGEVLSRARLYQAVYQTQYDGQDRSLDLMVSRLRRKFAHAGDLIRTVRGKGYLLAEGAQ